MKTNEQWSKPFCRFQINKNQGFTLIELLVTIIILGILTAVTLPGILGQVRKSRQSEAKINLGSMNRAQQSERFEKGRFVTIANLPLTITGNYYFYSDVGTPDPFQARYTATVNTTFEHDLHDYSAAVGQVSGSNGNSVICQQDTVDGPTAPIPPTVALGVAFCTTGTRNIF